MIHGISPRTAQVIRTSFFKIRCQQFGIIIETWYSVKYALGLRV